MSLRSSWGFCLSVRWTIHSHCTLILCLEFLQSSPLPILHFMSSMMVASSLLHSGKPNYSLFLTLVWSLVANTERSTWNVLSMSECPTPSPRSSYRQPEMTSPCEFPGCLESEAIEFPHTCLSYCCLGNLLFCSTCRTGSCLSLDLQFPAKCLAQISAEQMCHEWRAVQAQAQSGWVFPALNRIHSPECQANTTTHILQI